MNHLTASLSAIFQPQSLQPQSSESQAGATSLALALAFQPMAARLTASAMAIDEILRTLTIRGDAIALINGMGCGESVGGCSYAVALEESYPDFAHDATQLLNDGLERQSIPMVLAAMLVSRDHLPALLAPFDGDRMALLLRLLWLAQSDRELTFIFKPRTPRQS